MADDQKIQQIRDRIDQLDEQLQSMISERAQCAQEIAQLKNQAGEESNYYRPERESKVLQTVLERNQGPLSNEEIVRLFREIMSACLALQRPMKIAFLGPEGTFTQSAVFKQFGHSVTDVALNTIDEVFREVESGAADYGVIPVENSTEGVISHTLDMFMVSSLKICGEMALRIQHNLMGKMDDIAKITRVYAHQQALGQCRDWLEANLPDIEQIAVASNAEAARLASEQATAVACAGASAAEIYKLNILAEKIEDKPDNTTRFLVIGRQMPLASGNDKTSLLLSATNKPGALHRLLQPFADHEISMTRIESRPSRQEMWSYVFFVDIEGHLEDDKVAAAIKELESDSTMVKVLGSYPRAIL